MNKWVAIFELEDDDTMPEHMDLNYMGAKIDFHCRTMWIPCSKRLPEKDGHYIVYAPTYSGGSSSSKEYHDGVMFSAFKKGKWSIEHGYHKRPNCVRAWMPLPEAWKGENNG